MYTVQWQFGMTTESKSVWFQTHVLGKRISCDIHCQSEMPQLFVYIPIKYMSFNDAIFYSKSAEGAECGGMPEQVSNAFCWGRCGPDASCTFSRLRVCFADHGVSALTLCSNWHVQCRPGLNLGFSGSTLWSILYPERWLPCISAGSAGIW